MSLQFCSFSSGSKGNSYLVKSNTTAILVDAGISARKIIDRLAVTGTNCEKLKAILITHEHGDHTKSIKTLAKKFPWIKIFATNGTWGEIKDDIPEAQKVCFSAGESFSIGDIEVKSFNVQHDTPEPTGYSLTDGEKQISIVTDTGCITDEIHNSIVSSDVLVLEANHDVETLQVCSYPYNIKRRILGEKGHLSNEAAGRALCRIYDEENKYRQIILAHLSEENNFPELAFATVKNLLEEAEYYIGGNLQLHIVTQDKMSAIYKL